MDALYKGQQGRRKRTEVREGESAFRSFFCTKRANDARVPGIRFRQWFATRSGSSITQTSSHCVARMVATNAVFLIGFGVVSSIPPPLFCLAFGPHNF